MNTTTINRKRTIYIVLVSAVIVAIILFMRTCGPGVQASAPYNGIIPPIAGVEVPLSNNEVIAEEGGTIQFDNGTNIIIPANAFVDKNGNEVKGKVVIDYREFHTPADIIASGIPMTYEADGEVYNFESAGMFQIEGHDKVGNEIEVAPEKKITVNMASHRGDDDYGFYTLNEKTGKWKFNKKSKPDKNENKIKIKAELESTPSPTEPRLPEAYDEKKFTFDLSVDTKSFPELRSFKGIVWRYAGQDPKNDPEKDKSIFRTRWSNIKLSGIEGEENLFQLTLSNFKSSRSMVITPVFKGKDLQTAMAKFEKKKAKFDKLLAERKEQEKLADLNAEFIRSAQLSGFGVFNYDRYYHRNDVLLVNADFIIDGKTMDEVRASNIYLIVSDRNSIVDYSYGYGLNKFSFFEKTDNKIIVIFKDKTVAAFSNSDFKSLPVSQIRSAKGEKYSFRLRTLDAKVESLDGLSKIIESI